MIRYSRVHISRTSLFDGPGDRDAEARISTPTSREYTTCTILLVENTPRRWSAADLHHRANAIDSPTGRTPSCMAMRAVEFVSPPTGDANLDATHDDAPPAFRTMDNVLGRHAAVSR